MQFKRQGRRIQVLAYRGYDKEKRRAIIKMLGSIDAHSYDTPVSLLNSLTDEEKIELQSYIENERQSVDKIDRQCIAKYSDSHINKLADIIKSGDFEPSAEWATRTWAAIEELAKAMRKAGYPKPTKKRAEKKPLPGQKGFDLSVLERG